MAEAILINVLGKLANAAFKESLFIYGARDKLDSLEHELGWIQAFLKDAESKRNSDERVKTWVSDVRDVAYRIEDVIDMFSAVVDEHNQPSKINALKRVLKNPRKLPVIRSLTCEIDNIQTRLHEIKVCAERYGINELGDNSSASVMPMRRPVRQVVLPDDDDPNIVGLQKDTESIIKLLLDPNTKRRCVVSIVGQGGLGKSTLARKVYNSGNVKNEFEYRIWLSVSQQYELLHLLKTMLQKIRPLEEKEKELLQNDDQHSQQRAEEHFLTELKVSLEQKRYLIIMDDVWTKDLWIQVKVALPDVGNGSRVLVTTRLFDIAKEADPISDPYFLHYLSKEESQQLLLKKAFPGLHLKTYPHELSDLPNKFSEKCGGLPLALEVVGGLLSKQSPTYNSWHKVFKKFSWDGDEGKKCVEILATSYEDLPFFLKPCFMYFALFPEDHDIKAKSLIRMWVAEGFILEEDSRTMEEVAEDYLDELIQRSMIQVSRRHCNGSIKYCRIHDLLRDIAVEKSKENRFAEILFSEGGNCSSRTANARRTAIQCDNKDSVEKVGPNLRSLMLFGNKLVNIERFRLLKVLNGTYNPIVLNGINEPIFWPLDNTVKKDTFKELAQLRYLRMTITLNFQLICSKHLSKGDMRKAHRAGRQIWKSISRMRNLQILDIPKWDLIAPQDFFDCLWDIKTLRHVILPSTLSGYVYGPPSIAELPNLQTLKFIRAREEWLTKGWPSMPNIRVLKVVVPLLNYGESFRTFLSGLYHLTSLQVRALTWEYEIGDMSAFPCYNFLQSLVVDSWHLTDEQNDLFPIAITTSSFPVHLTKIKLVDFRIKEDPMPILGRLDSLKILELRSDAYIGRQLCCSSGGFPQLQSLKLDSLKQLEEWKADVEEGTMPMPVLKEITLVNCHQLQFIPGLHHMTSLTNFTLKNGSPELHRSLD